MNRIDSTAESPEAIGDAPSQCPASPEARPLSTSSKWHRVFSHRWVLLGLRLAIGALFLYAGVTKTLSPQAFADSVATFRILPPALINLVALALPPFEVFLGLMLVVGLRLRAGYLGAFLLTTMFVLALGQGIARGLSLDCGCFGSGEPSVFSAWISFGRAFLLMVVAGWGYAVEARKYPQDRPFMSA